MSKAIKPRIVAGVKLPLVRVSPEWQPRESLSTEHLRELVEAIQSGAVMPPLDVVDMPDGYALVDGYHRHAALCALKTPTCDVRIVATGDETAAKWWSLAANRGHGLKRTNAEKRAAVKAALAHAYGGDMSSEDLAAHCGVSLSLIADVRQEMAAPSPKAQATERAEAAVSEERERVASGAKPRSNREVAREAGVSRAAVDRAVDRVAPSTENDDRATDDDDVVGLHAVPDPGPWDAVAAAITALKTRNYDDIEALGPSVAQRVRGLLDEARGAVTASRPVACPVHTGPRCVVCGGAGWCGSGRARDAERGQ